MRVLRFSFPSPVLPFPFLMFLTPSVQSRPNWSVGYFLRSFSGVFCIPKWLFDWLALRRRQNSVWLGKRAASKAAFTPEPNNFFLKRCHYAEAGGGFRVMLRTDVVYCQRLPERRVCLEVQVSGLSVSERMRKY